MSTFFFFLYYLSLFVAQICRFLFTVALHAHLIFLLPSFFLPFFFPGDVLVSALDLEVALT